jgi:predicted N-acetyltransferase YhbS
VTALSLGDPAFTPLKTYLTKHAKAHQRASLARTYVAVDGLGRIKAYITIICGEIEVQVDHEGEDVRYDYTKYPAVKIARLAVDKRVRGNRLGEALVDLAIGVTRDIVCPHVGCRFIVVDSKQQSVAFYGKCGFTLLATPDNRDREEPIMFIDLHKT